MATKKIQAEYQLRWIKQRRQDWVDEHGPCAKCGSLKDLEVDHIDPKLKLTNVAQVWGMSLTNPKRIAELAKCQVLCGSCHLVKTAGEECPQGHPMKGDNLEIRANGFRRCLTCRRDQDREWKRDKRAQQRAVAQG